VLAVNIQSHAKLNNNSLHLIFRKSSIFIHTGVFHRTLCSYCIGGEAAVFEEERTRPFLNEIVILCCAAAAIAAVAAAAAAPPPSPPPPNKAATQREKHEQHCKASMRDAVAWAW
jgi:hypothetical protein